MAKSKKASVLRSLQIVTGDLQENCYLLWVHGAKEAIVFDPGDEPEKIRAALNENSLTPAAFVLTHCHGDHIGALTPLKAEFPNAPIYVHEAEREWLVRPLLNLSYFVGGSVTGPRAEHLVNDDDVLELIGLKLRAIHVPGHSPGGTAYFVEDPKGGVPHLFCGDILFQGSIGRTDLPGGAGEATLVSGIRNKLLVLPDETRVHTGHGLETTIGEEKEFNPYCGLSGGGLA